MVSASHNRAVTHWAGHSLPMNLTLDRSDSTHCAFAETGQAWFESDLQASLVHLALRSGQLLSSGGDYDYDNEIIPTSVQGRPTEGNWSDQQWWLLTSQHHTVGMFYFNGGSPEANPPNIYVYISDYSL